MMSVLCTRKQQEILFVKGAPECVFSRCSSVLCNDDGSAAPMTAEIRAELDEKFYRFPAPAYLPAANPRDRDRT